MTTRPDWYYWERVVQLWTPRYPPAEDFVWDGEPSVRLMAFVVGIQNTYNDDYEGKRHLQVDCLTHRNEDGDFVPADEFIWTLYRREPVESNEEQQMLAETLRTFLEEHGIQLEANDDEE